MVRQMLRQVLIGYRRSFTNKALCYKLFGYCFSALNTVNLVYLFSRNDSSTVLRTVQWEFLTFGMMSLENIIIEITAKPGLRGHCWQGQMTA